jgi:hypothetical protein
MLISPILLTYFLYISNNLETLLFLTAIFGHGNIKFVLF